MICVIQRISRGSVSVEGKVVGSIGRGLNVLLCAVSGDSEEDVDLLCAKIPKLRIFPDDGGKNNLSLIDKGYSVLVVSNFTLAADCKKGNRPSYFAAGSPQLAEKLYLSFLQKMKDQDIHTEAGVFGAHMEIDLKNDGPVTIILNSADLKKSSGTRPVEERKPIG